MTKLQPGDRAPEFSLEAQDGSTVNLTDFRGKKLLLYFYPKADTPGCTKQSCSVRDARGELWERGVAVLGVSPDTPGAQKKFDAKYSLGFPLLSDPDHKTAEEYGAWGEKNMYGRKVQGMIRSSFLIDEEGVIVRAIYKVKPEGTVPMAREAIAGAS